MGIILLPFTLFLLPFVFTFFIVECSMHSDNGVEREGICEEDKDQFETLILLLEDRTTACSLMADVRVSLS